jgi:hypothetical protein
MPTRLPRFVDPQVGQHIRQLTLGFLDDQDFLNPPGWDAEALDSRKD